MAIDDSSLDFNIGIEKDTSGSFRVGLITRIWKTIWTWAAITKFFKVALDFVSPENAHRCVLLNRQFAKLPRGHHLSEDKLQVKTMLLHAMGHMSDVLLAQPPTGHAKQAEPADLAAQPVAVDVAHVAAADGVNADADADAVNADADFKTDVNADGANDAALPDAVVVVLPARMLAVFWFHSSAVAETRIWSCCVQH